PGLQSDEIERVVTGPHKAQQAEAGNARGVLDAGRIGEDSLNLSRCCRCSLQRSRVGELHVDEEVALVFIGQEARGQLSAEEKRADAEGRNHYESQHTLPNKPTA